MPTPPTDKPKRAFWLHQAAEYLIGLCLVASGLQSPSPAVPAVLGGIVVVNAAIVDAPLGAFRVVGRRTHRVLDLVVLALLAVGCFLPGIDPATRLVTFGLTVVFGFVVFGTNYGQKAMAKGSAQATGGKGEDIGRAAGRLTARGVQAAKKKLG